MSVTVPVAAVPPTTSLGLMLTLDSAGAGAGGGGRGGGGWGGGGGCGGGGATTAQPDNVAVVAFGEPSFTATRQSLGAENEELSILNEPEASLVPIATPFTVIDRFGVAVPSSRSLVPLLSSARVIWTAASAEEAVANTATSATQITSANRVRTRR